MSGELRLIRKSLIATTAVTFILWADKNTGINWIVDIDGVQVWFFLGIAHLYFSVMWAANQGLQGWFWDQAALRNDDNIDFRHRIQRWMERPFGNICWVVGFGVIVWNLYTVYFGSVETTTVRTFF